MQFEAQLLSGCSITNETEALAAMKVFHSKGVRIVILSSTDFEKSETEKVKKESVCLASQRLPDGTFETARIVFPTLPVHFVGTGETKNTLYKFKTFSLERAYIRRKISIRDYRK